MKKENFKLLQLTLKKSFYKVLMILSLLYLPNMLKNSTDKIVPVSSNNWETIHQAISLFSYFFYFLIFLLILDIIYNFYKFKTDLEDEEDILYDKEIKEQLLTERNKINLKGKDDE